MQFTFKCLFLRTLIIAFMFLSIKVMQGQEMLGITQSNYGGSLTAISNPANINDTKIVFDVNILGGNFFFRNNFIYLPRQDATIWDVFFKPGELPTYGDDNNNFTYYDNHDLKFTNVNLYFQGPSAMYNFGRHGIGIRTAFRFVTNGGRIPWEVAVIGYEGMKYSPLHNIIFDDYDMDVTSSTWFELGLTYAYDIIKFNRTQLTAGITIKPLFGITGIAGNVRNANYIVLDDSTISFKNLDGDVAFAFPVNYDNNTIPGGESYVQGNGVGLDVGVVYSKKRYEIDRNYRGRTCEKPYNPYAYKIGISIVDIGRINYKKNAQEHTFENVSAYWSSIDTTGFNNMNDFVGNLSELFYGDRKESFRSDHFMIGLPTAISVQADFYLKRNIFLNAFWLQPVKMYRYSLKRASVVAVTPRYETPWFEASLPVTVYDYRYMRVGLALRFWFITIGTERLGTYLGLTDLNGLDIYGSIKFQLVKGSCKFKGPNKCLNYEFGIQEKDRRLYRKRR